MNENYLQVIRTFRKMIIFPFQRIVTKNHQANSDWSKYGNNDDPRNWFIDIFCTSAINVL